MGRKKKKASKPWCWYCNREFDDEKILIQHQKAKHFKCHSCHKKLYTGPGLSIHCMQVHKEAIDKVPNSLPHRSNIEIEIYGMEGIPADDLKEHEKQRAGGASGRASDSDDDEPAAKKKTPAGQIPGVSGVVPPGVAPAGALFPIPGMLAAMPQPYMQAPPGMLLRPMFPSAGPTLPTKPTFPAYSSSATISAPPTSSSSATLPSGASPITSAHSTSSLDSASHNGSSSGAPLVTSTGAASRIVHPPEDVSLEEIRARRPRYARPDRRAPNASPVVVTPSPVTEMVSVPVSNVTTTSLALSQQGAAEQMAAHLAAAAARQQQALRAVSVGGLRPVQLMGQLRPGMSLPSVVGVMPHAAAAAHAHAQAHAQAQAQAQAQMQMQQAQMQQAQMQQAHAQMQHAQAQMQHAHHMMAAMPQINMLRPPMQLPPGMLMGGMMGMPGMAPMFPGAGLPMMPPRFR